MKIAIFTLCGQRDEFIDNLLAEHLKELGHEAVVRNYIYAARESVIYDKPDAIVHPMPGGQYKYDFIKQCQEWGVEVIVRRGEAGMGREQFEKLTEDQKSIILGNWDYSPYVDLELTWGQEFTDIIAEQGWMPATKMRTCGAFAFDPYFQPDFKRNTDHEKTVLFATGFSTADCRQEHCELGISEDSDYHQKIYAKHRRARDTWIEAIKELVEYFSDMFRFELKVRPGEMTTEYEEKLTGVKIHPQESSSSEVLRNVDILVHSGSTMAIEAHLLGMPSFNFCNVNQDRLLAKVSPNLSNYRELEWNLTQARINHSNINKKALYELQEHLYGLMDGKACKRAAWYIHEHIDKLMLKTTDIPDAWPKTTAYLEEGVHIEKQEGDARWLCPGCRNFYYATPYGITKCPYCGMPIEMKARQTQGVVK